MRLHNVLILVCLGVLLTGCAVGQAIKNNYQGHRYLQTKQYKLGEETFRNAVIQNPDDAGANYFLGRFLLANSSPEKAMPYLEKAVFLDPKATDNLFWLGVAQGEIGNYKQERKSYQRVLQIDPNHLQSLIYLGHNQLKAKAYDAALVTYNKVLALRPTNPSALYNKALIARIQKRTSEEKTGWLAYLKTYPSGDLAIQATEHLNQLGDYTFENHSLGSRTVTIKKIEFEPASEKLVSSSLASLDVVGATALNIAKGKLQVLVYQNKDRELARTRAVSIKKYLLKKFPGLTDDKVSISWFGQPEKGANAKLSQQTAVRFFLTGLPIAG